jgi:hypothetical protein
MRLEARVGENGQITIPTDLLEALRLAPDAPVEVELTPLHNNHNATIDWDAVHKIVAKVRQPLVAGMRADGYDSVDEYIHDVRDRDAFADLSPK